jgi:hypothetical protein
MMPKKREKRTIKSRECVPLMYADPGCMHQTTKKIFKKNEVGVALVQNDLELVFPLIRREN